MSSQEPTPPLIQIPNESSASIVPSPGTTVATPTSSSAMVPLVLKSGENKNDDQGHKRPLTFEAWNYYKRQKIDGHWKAICVYCNKHLGDETKNGTSYLRDHTRVCLLKSASDIRQTFLRASKNQEGKTELGHGFFNQDIARRELAYMVTLHELPLSIIDHIGFRRFVVASLQPRFKHVSRNTIKKDIMGIYRNEKTRIKKLLEDNQSRIAITTDMWTSNNQKRDFMVITAHFIDNSWILQNQIIHFQYVPCPHSSEVLAKILLDCLMDWNFDRKLSTITVDNCSTNDAMVNVLLGKFSDDSLWVEGILIHMHCSTHILNIIVKDGLEVIVDGIEKVRDSVAFWTATPKREEKFEEAAKQLKIIFSKKLFLDCKTRWNSTYLMLHVALYYKDVFSRLKQRNPQYKCSPLEEDWEMTEEISSRLILFYEITELFSRNKYPITNILFPKIYEIKIALKTWLTCGNVVIETMAEKMLDKFDKYWSEVHGIMALATVLDPRYKMELVEFYFIEIYGDRTKGEMQKVLRLCYDLIDRYQSKTSQNERSVQISSHAPLVAASSSSMIGNKNFVEKFKTFLNLKGSAPAVKSKLDAYLEERVVPFEVEETFDILNWWKVHGARFPILQMLVKDVFVIPISTVPSESAFSTSGRVISPHRSKLKPNTIQALMCLQDWLKKYLKGSKNDGNFFNLFEELEENDGEGDESGEVISST